MNLFEISKFAVLISLSISLCQPAPVLACSFCTVPSAPKAESAAAPAPTPSPQPVAQTPQVSNSAITMKTLPKIGTIRSSALLDSKAFFGSSIEKKEDEEPKRPVYQITGDQIYSGSGYSGD